MGFLEYMMYEKVRERESEKVRRIYNGRKRAARKRIFFCEKVRIENVTAPKHKLMKGKEKEKRKIGCGSLFPPELIDPEKLVENY
jgi:hypothetical protein